MIPNEIQNARGPFEWCRESGKGSSREACIDCEWVCWQKKDGRASKLWDKDWLTGRWTTDGREWTFNREPRDKGFSCRAIPSEEEWKLKLAHCSDTYLESELSSGKGFCVLYRYSLEWQNVTLQLIRKLLQLICRILSKLSRTVSYNNCR